MNIFKKIFRTRVKFRIRETRELKIGYLIKDDKYTNGFKVVTEEKVIYTLPYIDKIDKI